MTDNDRYLFDLQGYLTIPNALDADQLSAMNELLDEHIAAEMAADDSTHRFGGMPFHHHGASWASSYPVAEDLPVTDRQRLILEPPHAPGLGQPLAHAR